MAREGKNARGIPWVIVAVLAGWLLVIVVGAGPAVDDALLGVRGLDDVWVVFLFFSAFAGMMMFIFLNPFTKTFTAPERKRNRWGGIIALVILFIVLWKPSLLDFLRDLELADLGGEAPESPEAADESDGPGSFIEPETVAQATDVLMLVGALVAVLAVWWLVRSRLGVDADDQLVGQDGLAQSELVAVVNRASLVLDAEDDPRLAVLKAYAILEEALADNGTPRKRAETPREHLERAMVRLNVDTKPLLDLADLYERARFSEQPMTRRDRDRAAALLAQAQQGLTQAGTSS